MLGTVNQSDPYKRSVQHHGSELRHRARYSKAPFVINAVHHTCVAMFYPALLQLSLLHSTHPFYLQDCSCGFWVVVRSDNIPGCAKHGRRHLIDIVPRETSFLYGSLYSEFMPTSQVAGHTTSFTQTPTIQSYLHEIRITGCQLYGNQWFLLGLLLRSRGVTQGATCSTPFIHSRSAHRQVTFVRRRPGLSTL